MPSPISRLNCFSNKKKKTKRRSNKDRRGSTKKDNIHQGTQLLLSGGSSSETTASLGKISPTLSLSSRKSNSNNNDNKKKKRDPTTSSVDDNSIPTLDSDYNNIQSANYSLSDAGGTIGSQNQQSLSNFSQAASALGFASPGATSSSSLTGHLGFASPGSSSLYNNNNNSTNDYGQSPSPYTNRKRHDEMLEIYAPRGKLGLVIDTPASSTTPIVHAIKDTCPIRNEIYVGDKLVAVDDVDVRDMTAVNVSILIGNKSGQRRRKLTIIRSARGM